MSTQSTPVPQFSVKDLQDPTEFKLNKTFAFIYEKLGLLYGSGGNVSLGSNLTVAGLSLATGSQVPTDPSSVLTLGAAESLFAPANIRKALVYGTYSPTIISQPLPIPPTPGPAAGTVTLEASDFCGGGGLTQSCINNAIAALPSTGGAIHCRTGIWSISGPVNCNKANVLIFGDGSGTVMSRTSNMPAGQGMFNVTATGISLQSMQINGNVTTSIQLEYNTAPPNGFNVPSPETGSNIDYPLASTLTINTSVWVHGGANGFFAYGLLITASGGYGILFDASLVNLVGMFVQSCNFQNNLTNTFGTNPADLNYGSWTGNIAYIGGTYQGGGGSLSAVIGLTITNCNFDNITGTGIFGYSPQLTVLHQNIVVSGCHFQDFGLDGINTAVAQNVTIGDNTFYRGGYIGGSPMWINTTPSPVAIDTSGFVRSAKYVGNTIFNINGEGIDLDGFADGTVSGNNISNASPTDYYYTLDQVGSYTVGVKGIQTNNSFDPRGAKNVSITGNTIRNMNYNSIVLFNPRNSIVSGNTIYHPSSAAGVPIIIQNNTYTGTVNTSGTAVSLTGGTSFDTTWLDNGYVYITINNVQYKIASVSGASSLTLTSSAGTQSGVTYVIGKTQNNTVTGNSIYYDAVNLCILEDSQYGNVYGPNHIFNNRCIGSNSGEFNFVQAGPVYAPPSGNTTQSNLIVGTISGSAPNAGTQQTIIQREGTTVGNNAVTKLYSYLNGVGAQVFSVTDATIATAVSPNGPVCNVAANGAALTGAFSTANRTAFGFMDIMATGKLSADSFVMVTDTSYQNPGGNDAYADALPNTYGLIRYVSSLTQFQVSSSVSGGHRVWVPLATGGGGTPGGNPKDVQFQSAVSPGNFAGSDNFIWDNTPQVMTVTGLTGTAAIVVAIGGAGTGGYMQSAEGFFSADAGAGTPSRSYQNFHSAAGGMWAQSVFANHYMLVGNSNGVPGSGGSAAPVTPGDVVPTNGNIYYDTGLNQLRSYINGSWTTLGAGSGSPGGANTDVQINNTGAFAGYSHFTYNDTTRVMTVVAIGSSSYAAILLTDGTGQAYIQSDGGILANSTSTAAIHAPNGGLDVQNGIVRGSSTSFTVPNGTCSAKDLVATDSAFNSIQAVGSSSSGIYGSVLTCNFALYLQNNASSPVKPSSTYSGFAHKSGSVFWYYNDITPGWATVDFSVSGGGVTSITGTTNEVIASASTGAVTLSLPQAIATTSNVSFNTVTTTGVVQSQATGAAIAFQTTNFFFQVTGSGSVSASGVISSTGGSGGFGVTSNAATNSIQTVGGVNVSSGGSSNGVYQVHGSTVITATGEFVGNGVSTSLGVQAGGGFAVGANNGQTYVIKFSTGVTFSVNGSGTFTTMHTTGGLLTSVS